MSLSPERLQKPTTVPTNETRIRAHNGERRRMTSGRKHLMDGTKTDNGEG